MIPDTPLTEINKPIHLRYQAQSPMKQKSNKANTTKNQIVSNKTMSASHFGPSKNMKRRCQTNFSLIILRNGWTIIILVNMRPEKSSILWEQGWLNNATTVEQHQSCSKPDRFFWDSCHVATFKLTLSTKSICNSAPALKQHMFTYISQDFSSRVNDQIKRSFGYND